MSNFSIGHLDLTKLSKMPLKIDFYFTDPFFREFAKQLSKEIGSEINSVLSKMSLVLIRPEAMILSKANLAVKTIIKLGFTPLLFKKVNLDWIQIRELYRHSFSRASEDRILLHDRLFSLSGAIAILFYKESSTTAWPAAVDLCIKKGAAQGKLRDENNIRSILGSPNRYLTLLHVSDEPADVVRELAVLFSYQDRSKFALLIKERYSKSFSCEKDLIMEVNKIELEASERLVCDKSCEDKKDLRYRSIDILNNIPENCPVKHSDPVKWQKEMTLDELDEELSMNGCNCNTSKWVSLVLAGECINAYDPEGIRGPFGNFKLEKKKYFIED